MCDFRDVAYLRRRSSTRLQPKQPQARPASCHLSCGARDSLILSFLTGFKGGFGANDLAARLHNGATIIEELHIEDSRQGKNSLPRFADTLTQCPAAAPQEEDEDAAQTQNTGALHNHIFPGEEPEEDNGWISVKAGPPSFTGEAAEPMSQGQGATSSSNPLLCQENPQSQTDASEDQRRDNLPGANANDARNKDTQRRGKRSEEQGTAAIAGSKSAESGSMRPPDSSLEGSSPINGLSEAIALSKSNQLNLQHTGGPAGLDEETVRKLKSLGIESTSWQAHGGKTNLSSKPSLPSNHLASALTAPKTGRIMAS